MSSCDIAKSALANAGVSYINQPRPAGQRRPWCGSAGDHPLRLAPRSACPPTAQKAVKAEVARPIKDGLARAGYPAKADPKQMNLAGAGRRCCWSS